MARLPDILRTKSNDRHLYAVGRIRALETRLLDKDIVRELVEAPTLRDVYNDLRDTEYGEEVVATEETLDFERLLSLETRQMLDLIDSISPDPELTDLIIYQFDVQNIKMLLKARLAGAPAPDSFYTFGRFPLDDLRALVQGESVNYMPRWLADAVSKVESEWKNTPNLRIIDAILDGALAMAQLESAQNAHRPVLITYFQLMIDTQNVNAFIRIRISERSKNQFEQFFVPGGELSLAFFKDTWDTTIRELGRIFENTSFHNMVVKSLEEYQTEGTLTMLEVEKKRLLLELLKPSQYITFGPEPILAYLITKLYEIELIRLIMVAKKNGLPVEDLRKRVMVYYV